MCAGINQRHLTPADVESAAASLGVSGPQLDRLKECTKPGNGQPSSANLAKPEGANSETVSSSDQPVQSTPEESSVEASFRHLANPDNQSPPPSPARLEQFGYSLFSAKVSTFAPIDAAPVTEDYMIGPGDQLNILMWGRVNQTLHLDVQRDGSVLLPQL